MTHIKLLLLTSLAAFALNGAVLYEPTPIGSSARFSDYGSAGQFGFQAFDNFTLASDATVERATWRGFWLDQPQPAAAPSPDVLSWQLAFYSDNAGAPGSLLSVETILAADVTSTSQGTGVFNIADPYNVSFYEYSVNLTSPFFAAAGTQYWFSVLSLSENYAPTFALRGATGGDDSSYQQTLGAGMGVTNGGAVARDRAILLEGTVPEPGTYLLTLAGVFLLPIVRAVRSR